MTGSVRPPTSARLVQHAIAMRILIVDDDEPSAELLGHVLRRRGHGTLVVTRPTAALALAGDVDLVISDLDMPEMTGVELVQRIRAAHGPVRVAFCSGRDPQDELARAATCLGGYLRKPWSRDELDELLAGVAVAA